MIGDNPAIKKAQRWGKPVPRPVCEGCGERVWRFFLTREGKTLCPVCAGESKRELVGEMTRLLNSFTLTGGCGSDMAAELV